MEKEYFDELMSSLKEAAAFAKGDTSRCRVISWESPVPEYKAKDVAQVRRSMKLSQKALASALGVSPRTVEAWEAGRNTPSGAARHLLYLFECDHSLVNRMLQQTAVK